MSHRLVVENATVATVDLNGTEYGTGHVVIEGERIVAVGPGPAPDDDTAVRIDGTGCLVTPGLVNTHHHFYQWLTRGLVQDGILFDWLVGLYPIWSRLDEDSVYAGARGSIASLLLSGCTTAMDHHYVFPRDGGDPLSAEIRAATELGLRFHATRGSMDLGESSGGLPPDSIVESIDEILAASAAAVESYHDPSPASMLQVALAPCSPFSVTGDLLRESASLARQLSVRLHTHGAETVEEETYCRERFGVGPMEYLDGLGWLGQDVWLAHCVHLSEADIGRMASSGTAVAHCPSSNARLGAGIAPVPELLASGVPVGLGVDGTASNEDGRLGSELRATLLFARARSGPGALTARDVLRIGTIDGARVLGRDAELGSLEAGKLADVAVWRIDGLAHSSIQDKVAALVMGSLPPLKLLLVNGRTVVEDGELQTGDTTRIAQDAEREARRLLGDPS
ncbi:MAG TPA: 8-oxoguanine deaminase [Jiangellaceae bacterium]